MYIRYVMYLRTDLFSTFYNYYTSIACYLPYYVLYIC